MQSTNDQLKLLRQELHEFKDSLFYSRNSGQKDIEDETKIIKTELRDIHRKLDILIKYLLQKEAPLSAPTKV